MAAPRVLSGVLLEAFEAWQKQVDARPISPMAEAAWKKAQATIAEHDRKFSEKYECEGP